jgi:hypothetical protein
MWGKEEKARDIAELVSKELACLLPMVKAATQLACNRCARAGSNETGKMRRCSCLAARRRCQSRLDLWLSIAELRCGTMVADSGANGALRRRSP